MAHIHEKIDFTVEVFIVYKNAVLLRKHDKYGIWLSVGGHIELDEDPNQAAIREVKEEVGLDVKLFDTREYFGSSGSENDKDTGTKQLIAPISLYRHRISETHEHVTLVYFAKVETDQVVPEEPTNQWKWCTLEDVEKMTDLLADVAFYAKKAIRTLA